MNARHEETTRTQQGRSFLITGTSGLGLETALALASAGGEVIVAGRNAVRGQEALETIRRAVPAANISFESVDLADLASIQSLGTRLREQRTSLDVLINNAGLMASPTRGETVDGFELQLGTNYLGPFALTHELIPLLRRGRNPRVVTVASLSANNGTINLADLQSLQSYRPMAVYAQSKLADLMFAFELERRSATNDWGITSIAVHPGLSRTDLVSNGPGSNSPRGRVMALALHVIGQSASRGALPSVFAATSPEAKGGQYYGPGGFQEFKGGPAEAKVPDRAKDLDVANQLWDTSLALTGTALVTST